MGTQTATKLAKIKRYSTSLQRLAQVLFAFGIVGATGTTLVVLLAPQIWPGPLNIMGVEYTGAAADGAVRALAALASIAFAGLLTKFFVHVNRLLALYAAGVIFTAESVANMRQIGVTLLLMPAGWLIGPLGLLLFGSGFSADAHITLVSAPVGQLVSGIIVILVSWIMDLGRELREEQDLVV